MLNGFYNGVLVSIPMNRMRLELSSGTWQNALGSKCQSATIFSRKRPWAPIFHLSTRLSLCHTRGDWDIKKSMESSAIIEQRLTDNASTTLKHFDYNRLSLIQLGPQCEVEQSQIDKTSGKVVAHSCTPLVMVQER